MSIHAEVQARVRALLRDVPDFPTPGILFKDITPLLADHGVFAEVIVDMSAPWRGAGITHVAGIESRGFLFAAPVALALGVGIIPLRKPGKLPWKTKSRSYTLEYGTNVLEMHEDACGAQSRVLVVDDVLATSGTALAACALLEDSGAAVVGLQFLLSIDGLGGVGALAPRTVRVLL